MKPLAPCLLLLLTAFACTKPAAAPPSEVKSPFSAATSYSDFEDAAKLARDGTDPNAKVNGKPLIFWALMNEDKAMADKLAEKGAELDVKIDGERLIDSLERAANTDRDDKASRAALEWLVAHGVKRHP